MEKIDYQRSIDSNFRIIDANFKAGEALYIPVFTGDPTINDNPDEDGAIGMKDDALVYYSSGTWKSLNDLYPRFDGGYSDPAWISSLAWTKIAGKPTTIAGYGITDFNSLGDARYVQTANFNTFGDARYLQLSGGTLTGDVQQTVSPVNANSVVTKGFVESYLSGFSWKNSVRVATVSNITLSGTQTVDGVALIANDRVLVKNQTTQSQNGIYIVAAGAWTRATDVDTTAEVVTATVLVRLGTINKDTQWTCTNSNEPVIGTDAITFGQISGAGTYTNGTGISLTGNVFALDLTYADARYLTITAAASTYIPFTGNPNDIDFNGHSIRAQQIYAGTTAIGMITGTAGLTFLNNTDNASRVVVSIATSNISANIVMPTLDGTIALLNGGQTFTNAIWHGTAIADTYISSSTNWNTAYSDRNKWDGGATGLVAVTARASLGLVIGTDVLAPNGSAASLTGFPTFNQNTTGSAATLTTARTINGVSFNGSANITVTAASGTLTGTTLNSSVVNSSLTTLGILTQQLYINGPNGQLIGFSTAGVNTALMGNSFTALGSGSKTDFAFYVYGNNPFSVYTNNTQRLIVDGSGNFDFKTGTVAIGGLITSTVGNNLPVFNAVSATTGYSYVNIQNTGGQMQFGVASSTGVFVSGSSIYAAGFGNAQNNPTEFFTNNTVRYSIAANGNHDFKSGNMVTLGTMGASNFSGSSSGTNTGDETTARINALYGYTPANGANYLLTSGFTTGAINTLYGYTPANAALVSTTVAYNDFLGLTTDGIKTTYTVGASSENLRIGVFMNVTTNPTATIGVVINFYDRHNVSQQVTLFLPGASGYSWGFTGSGVIPYQPIDIAVYPGTNVSVQTIITGSGTTYDIHTTVQKLR